MGAAIEIGRFYGEGAWSVLTQDQRAQIGAAALELAVALAGQAATEDPEAARVYIAAEDVVCSRMTAAAILALQGTLAAFQQIPVPSMLGDFCRVCHCSHFDPCPSGCGWAEPGLCTACADAASPAEAAEDHHG
jgi:hypothetical protein